VLTARWIHGPIRDSLVTWCWVPFAVAAHCLEPHGDSLRSLLGAVLVLSLAHQPLTLPLVYGDPAQFRVRRGIFTWSPLVFVAVIVLGINVSMGLVAAVAGIWNAEHTLMQRFGLTRIYGRKVGESDGRLERTMLQAWLVLALVWVAADSRTPKHLDMVQLGSLNSEGVKILQSLRGAASWMLVPVGAAVIVMGVMWWRREHDAAIAGTANPAKWSYVASSGLLFAVILIDPVAGFTAYVAAHALEYYAVVEGNLAHRGGVLRAVPKSSVGRWITIAGFGAGAVAVIGWVGDHASPSVYLTSFLLVGGLHVFYDGFIWKLKRPTVAQSFDLAVSGAES
jgi:hypothetical protein